MKQTILSAVSVLATFLVGCASTNVVVSSPTITAITHRPEDQSLQRSVGLLRRLAILPLQLDVTPQNPGRCALPCNWEALRRGLTHNSVDYLSTRRGYEVVTLDALASSDVVVDLSERELAERVGRLATFASRRSTEPPPEELADMVRDLGTQAGVDGIVILHGNTTTLTWMEVAAAFPLALSGYGLLAAIPIEMARLGTKLEADIFEVATGRLVWTSVFSARGKLSVPSAAVAALFDPIEPALPAVLTRPSTGLK
jgi:hypothetical protein